MVQGEGGRAAFGIRNDGNTRVRLGLRVWTGPGDDQVFESVAPCGVQVQDGNSPELQRIEAVIRGLRKKHEAVHQDLEPLDTDEKLERHRRLHHELDLEMDQLRPKAEETVPVTDVNTDGNLG